MEILIADTAMQIKSRYILTFVDVASPYYHDYIEKHTTFSDGTALNINGSIHDAKRGVPKLTKSERIWIFKNGWGG